VRFLLDTNVVSELRKKGRANVGVRQPPGGHGARSRAHLRHPQRGGRRRPGRAPAQSLRGVMASRPLGLAPWPRPRWKQKLQEGLTSLHGRR
jgi:hypothetical protein